MIYTGTEEKTRKERKKGLEETSWKNTIRTKDISQIRVCKEMFFAHLACCKIDKISSWLQVEIVRCGKRMIKMDESHQCLSW